jgi:single-stranded DNA-binding protein
MLLGSIGRDPEIRATGEALGKQRDDLQASIKALSPE